MKTKTQVLKKYRTEIRNILSGKLILGELEEAKHKAKALNWVLELSSKEVNTIFNEEKEKVKW